MRYRRAKAPLPLSQPQESAPPPQPQKQAPLRTLPREPRERVAKRSLPRALARPPLSPEQLLLDQARNQLQAQAGPKAPAAAQAQPEVPVLKPVPKPFLRATEEPWVPVLKPVPKSFLRAPRNRRDDARDYSDDHSPLRLPVLDLMQLRNDSWLRLFEARVPG